MKAANKVAAGSGEVYGSITQALVDRILKDTSFPFTVFEQWYPFPSSLKQRLASVVLPKAKAQKMFKWATDKFARDETAAQIEGNIAIFRAQVARFVADKKYADVKGQKWKGPSDKDLAAYQALDFDILAHLAYLKIFLPNRPSISLNGPKIDIDNLGVGADAIGELWVKRPKLECIKECEFHGIKFCCEVKVVWVWEKWATVSVNDFKIKADVTLYAELESLVVYLRGEFRKLHIDIDIPIIDQIPLEPIANNELKNKRVPVYDLSQLVVALPIINKKYQIDTAQISGTQELRVDLTLKLK